MLVHGCQRQYYSLNATVVPPGGNDSGPCVSPNIRLLGSPQVTDHSEPGVGSEEEGVCGAGPKLLDIKEAVQERASPHQTPSDQHAVSEECATGLFICQSATEGFQSSFCLLQTY